MFFRRDNLFAHTGQECAPLSALHSSPRVQIALELAPGKVLT